MYPVGLIGHSFGHDCPCPIRASFFIATSLCSLAGSIGQLIFVSSFTGMCSLHDYPFEGCTIDNVLC